MLIEHSIQTLVLPKKNRIIIIKVGPSLLTNGYYSSFPR